MSDPQSVDNILSFPPNKSPHEDTHTRSRRNMHPAVKRRRFLWLGCMCVFVLWFVVQIFFQQLRIWDREEKISMKQAEIRSLEAQIVKTKQSIKKLKSEDYLFELAHKLGYRLPDEEIYQIENE